MSTEFPNPTPPTPSSSAENWRLYLELISLSFFVFPFGNVLGPLVLWLIKKDTNPEVDAEGKKIINFNLSWTLWIFLSCGIGFLVWIVLAIIAIIKAANKEPFKHPLTIDFLK